MNPWNVVLIFTLIGLNAFFTATEFAVVASRRARLDVLVEGDDAAARTVRRWLEQPTARDRLIAATQLGITLVSLALGAVGENTFQAWLEPFFQAGALPPALQFLDSILPILPLVLSLLVITSLHVVLGEQVPKVAVLRSPERFALLAAPIMRIFLGVFRWFVSALDWATRVVLRLFGLPASSAHSIVFSVEEIKEMVSGPEVEGVIEEPERQMLRDVIDFGELVVRQVALPRTEIIAVEASEPFDAVVGQANQHSVTKMPVYEGSLDKVIGIVHVRDLLAAIVSGSAQGKTARDLMREALFVPETISLNDLLVQFRTRRTHRAMYPGADNRRALDLDAGMDLVHDAVHRIVGDPQNSFRRVLANEDFALPGNRVGAGDHPGPGQGYAQLDRHPAVGRWASGRIFQK